MPDKTPHINPDPENNFPKPDIPADKAWEKMVGLLDSKIPVSPSSAGGSGGGLLGGSSQILGIILAGTVTAGGLIWGVSSLKNKPDSSTEITNITESIPQNIVTDSSNSFHQITIPLTNEDGSSETSNYNAPDYNPSPATVQKEKSPSEKETSQARTLDISALLPQTIARKAQSENFALDGSGGFPELPDQGANPQKVMNPLADEIPKEGDASPADENPQVDEDLLTGENPSVEEGPLVEEALPLEENPLAGEGPPTSEGPTTSEGPPTSEEKLTDPLDSLTNKNQKKFTELKNNLSWYAGLSGNLGGCIQKERESTKYYGAMISSGLWHNKLGAGIETGIGLERQRDYSTVIENLRIPNQDTMFFDSLFYKPSFDTTQISEYKYLYHYVQVPLFISKQVWTNGKFSFTVKTGPLLGILISQKYKFENSIEPVYGSPVGNFDSDYSRLKLSWQWHALFQFGWIINDHLSFTISPHSVFYLNKLNENELVPAHKPLGIGVKGGLIYSF